METVNLPGAIKDLNGKPFCYMEELLKFDFRP